MSIDTDYALTQARGSLRQKTVTPAKSGEELHKQDFMNLFLTQMSHQDPVDPMDSGAMMSQLSQLGTMEQLEKLNAQVKDLNQTQQDISRFQSLQFLDKDVLLEADKVELANGSGKPVYYTLDNEANNLRVMIEDSEGLPVYSEQLGLTTAGRHPFVWDGKNNEGVMMPDGHYKISFLAYDVAGNSTPLATYRNGRISQVDYRNGQPWIKTQEGTLPLSKVKSVHNLSARLFGNATPLPLIRELYTKPLSSVDTGGSVEKGSQ
jgi:flagellar basal-body rod modification protein FlgD